MENNNFPSGADLENLVKELFEGREVAKQLQSHLTLQSPSDESCGFLAERIVYSYDQALSILTHLRPADEAPPPASLVASPYSDDSDQDYKDRDSGKRKAVETWSCKIKVAWPERGIEGQIDDGYGWRKYGQKEIIGAKYPRAYYKCTYRHAQGCFATRRVQRSDDDPTIYEITYRRKHTCTPRANNVNNPPTQLPDPQNEDPNPLTQNPLRGINQYLGTNQDPLFQPFDYPSSSAVNLENNNIFSDNNYNYGELIPNLSNLESELSLIVAAMTSTTNSSTVGSDFPFGSSGSGSNPGFGNPGYYP